MKSVADNISISLIEGGYGDSDVFLVTHDDKEFIRKEYQPVRMAQNLQKYLRPKFVQELVALPFLESRLTSLRKMNARKVFNCLETVVQQYGEDTQKISEDICKDPDTYRYAIRGMPGIRSVQFEVLPQGESILKGEETLIIDGQKVMKGMNMEQLLDVPEAKKRQIKSDKKEYPEAFCTKKFVDSILVQFNQALVRAMINNIDFSQPFRPFPIYNRIHPANVVPMREDGHSWKLVVTDLSTNICLDYALLLHAIDTRK